MEVPALPLPMHRRRSQIQGGHKYSPFPPTSRSACFQGGHQCSQGGHMPPCAPPPVLPMLTPTLCFSTSPKMPCNILTIFSKTVKFRSENASESFVTYVGNVSPDLLFLSPIPQAFPSLTSCCFLCHLSFPSVLKLSFFLDFHSCSLSKTLQYFSSPF